MSDNFKNQMQAVIARGANQPIANNHSGHELQGAINENVKRLVDKVFEQLKSIFPAWQYAWKDAKAIDSAKVEWVKAFVENNVNTVEQLKQGFKQARASGSDFLPSAGKFVKWCNKSVCDAESAYIRFVNREQPLSPVEVATRGEVGYNCRSMSAEKAERLWIKHYNVNYDKWVSGAFSAPETPLLTELVATKQTDTMRDNFQPSTEKSASIVARLSKIKAGKK